ncbi:MAG: DHHW family protein [Deltaproteobacteria bacterium]|nr:DHHW family protein [Deltaproteobacteria bacterium]
MQRADLSHIVNVIAIVAVLGAFGLWFTLAETFGSDGPAVSELENRSLAPMPVFSWTALKKGDYTRGLDAYVADHFPLREPFLELADLLKGARGIQVDDVVYDTPDSDVGGLEQIDTWAGADAGPEEPAPTDAGVGVVDAGPAVPKKQKKYKSGVSIVDDRALMFLVATDDSALAFAQATNLYAEKLDPAVRIYALVTPTATAFYLPADQQERSCPEDENLAAIQAAYLPAIRVVDVHKALAAHAGEDIFFRTDHHWTALGAYYAYAAFCAAAGLEAVELDTLEKKQKPATLGSLYRMTQNKVLKAHPDVVDYWPPSIGYTAVRYRDQDLKTAAKANFIVEGAKGYVVFLGGDDPMMVAKTDVKNGRKGLLVKNSFGNALAPFLLHNFEELTVVDYRYYAGNLATLVKAKGITDVILQNATVTANSRPHTRRLREALLGNGAAWEAETVEKQEERNRKYQEEHGILPRAAPGLAPATTVDAGTPTTPTTKVP